MAGDKQFWIVVSYSRGLLFWPYRHLTQDAAIAEAVRLARKHGRDYYVMEAKTSIKRVRRDGISLVDKLVGKMDRGGMTRFVTAFRRRGLPGVWRYLWDVRRHGFHWALRVPDGTVFVGRDENLTKGAYPPLGSGKSLKEAISDAAKSRYHENA